MTQRDKKSSRMLKRLWTNDCQGIVGWKRRRVWNKMLCLCFSSATSMTTWWAHGSCWCVGAVASFQWPAPSQVHRHSCLLLGLFHCPGGAAFFFSVSCRAPIPTPTHVLIWCNVFHFCGLLFIDGFNIVPVTNHSWWLQGNSTNASKKTSGYGFVMVSVIDIWLLFSFE